MAQDKAKSQGQTDDASTAASEPKRWRIVTCGDAAGKSTLIAQIRAHAKADGHEDARDGLMAPDGLMAEHDAQSHSLATEKRRFILADSGGQTNDQNVVMMGTSADIALVVVDADIGATIETHRHAYSMALLGVRNVVLVVNKMDGVGYAQDAFDQIVERFIAYVNELDGPVVVDAVPVMAGQAENIATRSTTMPWYEGPPLLTVLDTMVLQGSPCEQTFSMPVYDSIASDGADHGYRGRISSGTVRPGDALRLVPSGHKAVVAQVVTTDGPVPEASAGTDATVTLVRSVEITQGEVLAAASAPPQAADQFDVTLFWMSDAPLLPGRRYDIVVGAARGRVTVTRIKHAVNVESGEKLAAEKLQCDGIAECNISLDRLVPFRPYAKNRDLGRFLLMDRKSGKTVGFGLIQFALRRAENVHLQAIDVDRNVRAEIKHQKPAVLWFTGLSGSGKSTIANVLEKRLVKQGHHTILLDGDNVRHGLNRDLGFADVDRVENIRRIGEVSRLMADAGLLVLVSFISPFVAERRMARALMAEGEFIEIHVDTPLDVAEQRDTKGLYKKARAGEIKNFTGIDSPYERPDNPEIVVNTAEQTAEQAASVVEAHLLEKGFLGD